MVEEGMRIAFSKLLSFSLIRFYFILLYHYIVAGLEYLSLSATLLLLFSLEVLHLFYAKLAAKHLWNFRNSRFRLSLNTLDWLLNLSRLSSLGPLIDSLRFIV